MQLQLTIHNASGPAAQQFPVQKTSLQPGPQWLTIGRGSHCDWVLHDTERLVSREHARVRMVAHGLEWVDLGTNPSLLDGLALVREKPCLLTAGQVLRLGHFQLHVQEAVNPWGASSAEPASDALDELMPKPFEPLPADALDALIESLGDSDFSPSSEQAGESALNAPLDQDPFADLLGQRIFVGQAPAGPQQAQGVGSVPENVQEAPLKQASQHSVPHGLLLTRLEQALGVDAGTLTHEDQLLLLAQCFEISVGYCLELLKARRIIREESGTELTSIVAVGNNPLKFSASTPDAIHRLLRAPRPGFLPAEQALHEAFKNILQHMQADLHTLQQRLLSVQLQLAPEQLEALLDAQPKRIEVLPQQRKARLWDLYCEQQALLMKSWN